MSGAENGDRLRDEDRLQSRELGSPNFRLAEGRARFLPYALQLLLVLVSLMAWEILLQHRILGNEITGSPLGNVGFQVANGAAIGLIGLILGIVVQRIVPSAARIGRWVWLLPASVLTLSILWDFIHGFGIGSGAASYFFCAHPGRDETCMVRDLLTYPAWSAAWYSSGVAFSTIRKCVKRKS